MVKISVIEGAVILEGHVPRPAHKHLVEAIGWWLRGCRNVENYLEVIPAAEETDAELTDALRLVLEKDRLIENDQIRADIQDQAITLKGFVATEEEKAMVEADAWCLSGVKEVLNQTEVRKLEV